MSESVFNRTTGGNNSKNGAKPAYENSLALLDTAASSSLNLRTWHTLVVSQGNRGLAHTACPSQRRVPANLQGFLSCNIILAQCMSVGQIFTLLLPSTKLSVHPAHSRSRQEGIQGGCSSTVTPPFHSEVYTLVALFPCSPRCLGPLWCSRHSWSPWLE